MDNESKECDSNCKWKELVKDIYDECMGNRTKYTWYDLMDRTRKMLKEEGLIETENTIRTNQT